MYFWGRRLTITWWTVDAHICTDTHTDTRRHTHIHTCKHIHTHTLTHSLTHTPTHINTLTQTHIHTLTHAHIYTHIHAYVHTHHRKTHTHIHYILHMYIHIWVLTVKIVSKHSSALLWSPICISRVAFCSNKSKLYGLSLMATVNQTPLQLVLT